VTRAPASTTASRAPLSEALYHEVGNGRDRAAVLHELSEQRTEQKQRDELRQETRGAAHEGLRPVGKQRLACERSGQQGGRRSEQKHAPAAECEPYQQNQTT